MEYRIDGIIRNINENKPFNGSILVAKEGEVVYSKAFGCSDCKANKPNMPFTPFYIASISKAFTAIAILKLEEDGKLQLSNTLDQFFPDLPKWNKLVTVENLLNHTSGVPDYIRNGWSTDAFTNSEVYNKLKATSALGYKPGAKFKYSNSGYVLLAFIIEKVAGMSYSAYLDNQIFSVAEMQDTWVHTVQNASITDTVDRAIGYRSNLRSVDDYSLFTYGDGGIFSTADDLSQFANALLSDEIIGNSSLSKSCEYTVLENGTTKPYGYGWFLGENTEGKYVYHTGQMAGFRSYLEVQIDTKNVIVILNNSSYNNLEKIRNDIVKVLDGG